MKNGRILSSNAYTVTYMYRQRLYRSKIKSDVFLLVASVITIGSKPRLNKNHTYIHIYIVYKIENQKTKKISPTVYKMV